MEDRYLSPEARARIAESVACRQNISREQRRYEIAKDCMAAMVANPQTRYDVTDEELAEYATSKANALLAELDKEPLT